MRSDRKVWIGLLLFVFLGIIPGSLNSQVFEDERGDMSFALAGDAIITREMSPYREPEFLQLREIIQNATAAFVNLEVLFHDYEDDVIPAANSGGTYMRAHPKLAHELSWFGFDMVSIANNHTMDFGAGGARRTVAAAKEAGLAIAGFGENLARARQPAYIDTPGGRVALISIASTFPDESRAGHQRPDMRGRPGLSPIRYETHVTLTSERMEGLRAALKEYRPGFAQGSTVRFGGVQFSEGSTNSITTVPNASDLAEIVEVVKDAKRQAQWVLVTSHTHEGGGDRSEAAGVHLQVPERHDPNHRKAEERDSRQLHQGGHGVRHGHLGVRDGQLQERAGAGDERVPELLHRQDGRDRGAPVEGGDRRELVRDEQEQRDERELAGGLRRGEGGADPGTIRAQAGGWFGDERSV